jgi:ABC-type transporter Mla maintaining outer membrane lipid asymmetry ATPase subunit MlaF
MTSRPPSAGREAGLVARDVSFGYGKVSVVNHASISIPRGGVLVVTGENGIGKSTLLYLCAGLIAVSGGSITLDGHRPDALHPSVLFREGIRRGFVFQQGGLLSNQSAIANVTLALRYHADVLGLSEDAVLSRARAALAEVDVDPTDNHSLPAHLSFGVRKRVAVARALAIEPNFMFFDDPDAGLDLESAEIVARIIERCRGDAGVTILIATNSRNLIDRLAAPTVALAQGKITYGLASNVA